MNICVCIKQVPASSNVKIDPVNGTLVRDLVPCYRKSDGVVGMYDIVNKKFYTNSFQGTYWWPRDIWKGAQHH